MDAGDPVIASLEIAAERAGDLREEVYERYYAACPDAEQLMAHVDEHMQGRMLDEVLRLLMVSDLGSEQGYLNFEVENHRGYKVEPGMYPDLFRAVEQVVRKALGADWSAAFDAAWVARITALLAEIDQRASASAESGGA